jgi:tetratricopeptide repeat protein
MAGGLRRTRNWWRRAATWWKLAFFAALAAGAGVLASLWLPAGWAVVVGAVATAVFGGAEARHRKALESRPAQQARLAEDLMFVKRAGTLPTVTELDDPTLAGVHPAESVDQAYGEFGSQSTPYITRDIEADLRSAIRQGGFVLIVGESTAGKSRSAFEAVQTLCPAYTFIGPQHRAAIDTVLREMPQRDDCVVWLDELERFLGPGGLTTSTLIRLLTDRRGHVVIMATMRAHEFQRFVGREGAEANHELWRLGRDVLRMAHTIRLDRRWSPTEWQRAEAYRDDVRIARALRGSGRFGIAESLAAGPELADEWRNAWTPGTHPRAAALVSAAVDIRRAGVHGPVPASLLVELHTPYLDERGGPDLRPEPVDEALAWAGQPAYTGAASALLLSGRDGGLTAFDYLIDLITDRTVPDHLWDGLLSRVVGRDAYEMGLTALAEHWYPRADRALAIAAAAGVSASDIVLGTLRGRLGRHEEAVTIFAAIAANRTRALGTDHPETLEARAHLAYWTGRCGRPSDALLMGREVLAARTRILGTNHPDTLDSSLRVATWIGEAGDPAEALRRSIALLPAFRNVRGPLHPDTLDVHARIALWTGKSGDPAEALRLSEKLLRLRSSELGQDHFDCLFTRSRIVMWTGKTGKAERAAHLAAELVADLKRVCGSDHPRTREAREHLAQWTRASFESHRLGPAFKDYD